MTSAEVLKLVREWSGLGRCVITQHAAARMYQRHVTHRDVLNALKNAKTCQKADGEKWKVGGPDFDGDDLTVVVALESGLVVVTVY